MIQIGMNPNMVEIGSVLLTWHGFFAFVGVVVAVVMVARSGQKEGIISDVVYSTAVWAIIGGIVGARLLHVIDRWDFYSDNPGQIIAIWNGGIALFGSILGGFVGGSIYAHFNHYPIGKLADLTAPPLIIAQTIGRIGDIINGEHVSATTNFSWGFVYTHPGSLSNQVYGLQASHPTVVYEMIWNMLVLGVLWWFRGRIKPDGMLFALYFALYSFGRFFISFLREDKVWVGGLQEAHIIAIIVMAVAIPLLVYRARLVPRDEAAPRRARPQ